MTTEDRKMEEVRKLMLDKCLFPPTAYTSSNTLTYEKIKEAMDTVLNLYTQEPPHPWHNCLIVSNFRATRVTDQPTVVYEPNWLTRWFPRLCAKYQDKLTKLYGFKHEPCLYMYELPVRRNPSFDEGITIVVHPSLEAEVRSALKQKQYDLLAQWLDNGKLA